MVACGCLLNTSKLNAITIVHFFIFTAAFPETLSGFFWDATNLVEVNFFDLTNDSKFVRFEGNSPPVLIYLRRQQ